MAYFFFIRSRRIFYLPPVGFEVALFLALPGAEVGLEVGVGRVLTLAVEVFCPARVCELLPGLRSRRFSS